MQYMSLIGLIDSKKLFEKEMMRDIDAVENAVDSIKLRGVERTNNNLKTVKCTMYGRCS